jgi:hypothetical protein
VGLCDEHMDPINASNVPGTTPGSSPATAVHHSLVAASGEQCPSCGNPVAPDQRYCLHCGQRCGEPRLPFMNAVTFMDAMKRPAATPPASPPKAKRRSLSPNAALITGVGTLLLAMGVGVLIGQSGNDTSSAPQQAAAPIVIKGGASEEANTASTVGGTGKSSGKKASKKSEKSAKAAADSGEGAEEVLKPAGDVKLPPATVQPGEKCESGAAGCKSGEFTGEFFGE